MTDRKLLWWKYKPVKDKKRFLKRKKVLKDAKILLCLGIIFVVIYFPAFAFYYQGIGEILFSTIITISYLLFFICFWKELKKSEKLLAEDKKRLRIIL